MTLAILELATLFFVFYLGARYGPEFLGSAKLKAVAKEEVVLPVEDPKSVDEIVGKEGYTYPELLTDKEGAPVKREAVRIIGGKEIDSQGKEIRGAKKEAPKTPQTVRVKSAHNSKYTVQVGSFPTPEEASSSVEKWKQKGYDAFMSVAEIPNRGTWYRVRVGSFGNKQDAQSYVQQIKTKEKILALVVLTNS